MHKNRTKDYVGIRDRKRAKRRANAAKRAICACCGTHKDGMTLVDKDWLCPGCDHISKKHKKH
jgi:rubrerythrin